MSQELKLTVNLRTLNDKWIDSANQKVYCKLLLVTGCVNHTNQMRI